MLTTMIIIVMNYYTPHTTLHNIIMLHALVLVKHNTKCSFSFHTVLLIILFLSKCFLVRAGVHENKRRKGETKYEIGKQKKKRAEKLLQLDQVVCSL